MDLINSLTSNQIFTGTMLTGVLMGLLYSLKGIPIELYELLKRKYLFNITIDENYHIFVLLNDYLKNNHFNSFRNVYLYNDYNHDSSENIIDRTPIKYQQNNDRFFIFIKGIPIFFNSSRKELEGAKDLYATHKTSYTLTTIFKKNRTKLLNFLNDIHLEDLKIKKENKKIIIYTNTSCGNINHYKEYRPTPLENLLYNDSLKEDLVYDITKFTNDKELYRKRGIPYKRNYLLYGEPGTGKSSLIASIAHTLSKNLYYLDINSLVSESALKDFFINLPQNVILVIEDLHCIWDGTKPINKNCKITLSAFLNILSGILEKEDLIIFFTTNEIDKLHESLIRDRRVDKKYYVGLPNKKTIEGYLSLFFEQNIELNSYDNTLTLARVQNLCLEHVGNIPKLLKIIENEKLNTNIKNNYIQNKSCNTKMLCNSCNQEFKIGSKNICRLKNCPIFPKI